MRTAFRALSVAVVALFAACSSTTTTFDWDRHFDFSKLGTWSWADAKPGLAPDDLVKQRIDAAIEEQLGERGFRKADADGDFRVAWTVRTRDKVRAQDWGGYRDPHDAYWTGAYGSRTVDIQYYEEGTLIVDVVDPGDNRLIWRGTATKVLARSPSPEKIDATVRDVVAKLLGGFPPGSRSH